MKRLIDKILNFSFITDLERKSYSPAVIIIGIAIVAGIGFLLGGKIAEFSFLLYGIFIMYAGYVYNMRSAILVTAASFLLNFILQYPAIIELYNNQQWIELIVERFLIIIFFFAHILLFCILILKEREAKEKYKATMETYLKTSEELAAANLNINQLYVSTIQALAAAIEAKDNYTKGHSERVTQNAVAIARAINLPKEEITLIMYAAILHDVGKIGIDGVILKKPGRLTSEEYEHIKRHPKIGGSIISTVEFLQPIIPVVEHHHEYFDGTGYPSGIKGQEIPLGARILSLVDAYDAMMYDRPYRDCLAEKDVIEQIKQGAGTQFDPSLTEVFLDILDRRSMESKRAIS